MYPLYLPFKLIFLGWQRRAGRTTSLWYKHLLCVLYSHLCEAHFGGCSSFLSFSLKFSIQTEHPAASTHPSKNSSSMSTCRWWRKSFSLYCIAGHQKKLRTVFSLLNPHPQTQFSPEDLAYGAQTHRALRHRYKIRCPLPAD